MNNLASVLKKVEYEKMDFTQDGVKYDFDRYNVEMRSPLATHEYSVTVNHINKKLGGDVIRYGSWDDLEMEEIIEILELVEKEGKLERPFREYIPAEYVPKLTTDLDIVEERMAKEGFDVTQPIFTLSYGDVAGIIADKVPMEKVEALSSEQFSELVDTIKRCYGEIPSHEYGEVGLSLVDLDVLEYETLVVNEEDENVYLCNKCDEMYEEKTEVCELSGCNGTIRVVSKGDMGE
ncbi:hypothetical protein [Peribacillus frigoritolerans]|uniref:Uncharacterized protein n=1 Tax=Peribacillus castrilensis TaxID=2897690 RepID=A0AAW9NED8_9BACI|nr:hypothetical protein [Peribacillus castrilensis]